MDNNTNLAVRYDCGGQMVALDDSTVRNYLTKGDGNVTDQDVMLFLKLCEAQKLNPFIGEVHLIKYGNSPAQTVVGYQAYRKRAENNPSHLYCESGIVVQRGNVIDHKLGTCTYPGEKLLGGWCKVYKVRMIGQEAREIVGAYKEVSLTEYDSGRALWKSKPATMIEKVAISQALREAYPADFAGLYTPEEMGHGEVSESTAPEAEAVPVQAAPVYPPEQMISRKEQEELFSTVHRVLGETDGNAFIKNYLGSKGYQKTSQLTQQDYADICIAVVEESKKQTEQTRYDDIPQLISAKDPNYDEYEAQEIMNGDRV